MRTVSALCDLSDESFVHRPALLMCAPSLYSVDYVINPWMHGNVGCCSQARAMQQWHRLHNLLTQFAQVQLIEPAAGSPDMVFTANAGLVYEDTVVVSSFLHPERQGEEPHFRRWFRDAGYTVLDLPREIAFEGEGDALFSVDHTRLWVGHGTRTASASHGKLAAMLGVDVKGLRLVDPRFYHLDTCFAPLADGSVLYYPEAFDSGSLQAIEDCYTPSQRIKVSETDALRFACNAVNLGRAIVLNHISFALEGELKAHGFHVFQTPLDEFLKAGGAAKCLVLKLSPQLHMQHHVFGSPALRQTPQLSQC
jgi:ornithine--oxo-acid transaminase